MCTHAFLTLPSYAQEWKVATTKTNVYVCVCMNACMCIMDRFIYFLFRVIHVQCHQALCHSCGHLTVIFKFVAAKILLQYWRQMSIAQQWIFLIKMNVCFLVTKLYTSCEHISLSSFRGCVCTCRSERNMLKDWREEHKPFWF